VWGTTPSESRPESRRRPRREADPAVGESVRWTDWREDRRM